MISSHPLSSSFFSLLILYFGWSLVPCCVDPETLGYHWKASMCLSLATASPPGLWHVSAENSSCSGTQLPDAANLLSPPLPMGGWDSSVLTLPAGDGSTSPESQIVGLWMNNTGMERGEMEKQCLRLSLLCVFIDLCRTAQLLSPSDVVQPGKIQSCVFLFFFFPNYWEPRRHRTIHMTMHMFSGNRINRRPEIV